ncbi:hypothetical protein NMT12_30024 [metagenome]
MVFSLTFFQVINNVITKIVAVIELIITANVGVSIFDTDCKNMVSRLRNMLLIFFLCY